MFPNAEEYQAEDTAIAAKHLSEGKYDAGTAVLCRKNAGEMYDLKLIAENLEDDTNNYTEFRLFKLPEIDYVENSKPTVREWLLFHTVNENGIGYLSKLIIIASIFIAFYISKLFNMSYWSTAATVGGYLTVVLLFLTSNTLIKRFRYRSITGYWKYYALSDSAKDETQKFDTPRIVKIEEVDGELLFRGYICDQENVPFFESSKIILSNAGARRGGLVYWYHNTNELNRDCALNGMVELNWINKYPETKINRMSGYYTGKTTKDTGKLEYLRITEQEYKAHRESAFL